MARWPMAYPLSIGRVQAGDWASSVPDLLVAEGRLGVALDEPVGRPARARARGRRGQRRRPVAARPPGDGGVVGRAVRVRPAGRGQRPGRPGGRRPRAVTGGGRRSAGRAVRLRPAAAGRRRHPDAALRPRRRAVAHAPDERVPLAEVHTAAEVLARALLQRRSAGGRLISETAPQPSRSAARSNAGLITSSISRCLSSQPTKATLAAFTVSRRTSSRS